MWWRYCFFIPAVLIGSFAIVVSLLPILRHEAWWIRVWDFPRIQICFLGIISMLLFAIAWQPSRVWQNYFFAVLALAVVYQAAWVIKYTPMWPLEAQDATDSAENSSISIMVCNVLQPNRQVDKVLNVVNDTQPDVLLLLETNTWWDEALSELQETYPQNILQPQENKYGILLYSKLPIRSSEIHFLIKDDIPSIEAEIELRDGRVVTFYGVHPPPPFPTIDDESTSRDAELVIVGRRAREQGPAIVAGDMNDVAWSHTSQLFQEVSRMLDPRVGRGMYNSFHAEKWYARWPLDHIFHSDHFRVAKIKRLPYVGSDHFPVYMELSLESDAPIEQEAPEPDENTEEEADKKIEEVKEGDETIQ